MSYISERQYASEMKAIQQMNASREREIKLEKERNKYRFKFKMPSTSKIILFASILMCLQIIFFCENIMMELGDTSALYVLIGIPATMVPIIWAYYAKSKAENTAGGIVYETAMNNTATEQHVEATSEEAASEEITY